MIKLLKDAVRKYGKIREERKKLWTKRPFTVLEHYKNHRWNAAMVRNAIGRWITAAEAEEIIGTEE